MRPTALRSLTLASLFFTMACANASSYDALYAFGDSLSDNGSIPAVTSGVRPPPPYAGGRFSNGPVAVEYLAGDLGIAPAGLHDYAFGGASSGLYNTDLPVGDPQYATGTLSQVLNYQSFSKVADPNALYVVWAGSNDFLSITDPAQIPGTIATAVNNLVTEATILHDMGAQHLLIPNMPDLGLTPAEQSMSATAALLSAAFNSALAANLPNYVTQFDTAGLLHQVVAAPSSFGFSNVTDACVNVPSCANGTLAQQNQYLFWDDVHPTTAAHQLLAGLFAASAVPEANPAALFLAGLLMIAIARKRMKH